MVRLLLDNDFIQKLAGIHLLDEALAIFDSAPDVAVLHTFKYRWKKKRRSLPDEVQQTIDQLLQRASELTAEPRLELLQQMERADDIDQGEAVLFALAADDGGCRAITGDKRSVRGLAAAVSCAEVRSLLAGRIVVVERVVLALIDLHGFAIVKERVMRAHDLGDTALRAAFGSGERSTEAAVRDALTSYFEDLRSDAAELLWEP